MTLLAALIAAAAVATPPPVATRCHAPGLRATVVQFRAADGVLLDGALLGSGANGVVLLHELNADLCNWVPFARLLAARGFRVLLVDMRCYGKSECPTRVEDDGRIALDVLAGVAKLRALGVRHVAVGGASLGGSAALAAAAGLRPAPFAVISLSAPSTHSLAGTAYAVDPSRAVRTLRAPIFFAAGKRDTPFGADARALYAASQSHVKQLVVNSSADHGTELLAAVGGRLLRFIVEHAP